MTGFGLRDASDFVVSGSINLGVAASTTTCNFLRTSTSGSPTIYHNFVSSQNVDGVVSWYKSTSVNAIFDSLTIATNNVLVTYRVASEDQLRVLKLSLSTGAWVSEMIVRYSSSTGQAWLGSQLHRSQVASSNYKNYVSFTSYNTYSGLIRFDENLNIYYSRYWAETQSIVDMDFAADHSLALVYLNYEYTILNLNETNGNTIQDLTFTLGTNNAPANIEGCIRMDPSSSTWYAAIKDVPTSNHERVYLVQGTHAYSSTSALTFTGTPFQDFGNYFLRHPQLEVTTQSAATKLIFSAVQIPTGPTSTDAYIETERILIFYMNSDFSNMQWQYMQKGKSNIQGSNLFMRYYSISSALYLAYQIEQYIDPTQNSRIVYFKVSPTGDALGFSCTSSTFSVSQGSTPSMISGHSLGTINSPTIVNSDATAGGATTQWPHQIYNLTNIIVSSPVTALYDPANNLALLQYVADTDISEDSYLTTFKSCTGGATSCTGSFSAYGSTNNPVLTMSAANDHGSGMYYTLGIQRCDAVTSYNCTSLLYPNETAISTSLTSPALQIVGTEVPAQSVTQAKFLFGSNTTLNNEYVGTSTFELRCTVDTQTILPHVRYQIAPDTSILNSHSAATTAFTTPETCESPIFPIMYGNRNSVITNFFGQGVNAQVYFIAGKANQLPFAPEGNVLKGFLGMVDQYGDPFWIYYIDADTTNIPSQYAESECYQMSYDATHHIIYGVCASYNMELNINQGVLVKIDATSNDGNALSVTFLPRDYSSTTLASVYPFFAGVAGNSNLLIAQQYTFTAASGSITPGQIGFSLLNISPTSGKLWYKAYNTISQAESTFYGLTVNNMFVALNYDSVNGLNAMLGIDTTSASHGGAVTYSPTVTYTGVYDSPPTLISTTSLIVPLLSVHSSQLYILDINPVTSAITYQANIEFPNYSGNYKFHGASVSQTNTAFHVVITGTTFVYFTLVSNFATVHNFRAWEFQGSSTDGYYESAGQYPSYSDSFYLAVTGQWSSEPQYSTLILRLSPDTIYDINDYSCTAFRELGLTEDVIGSGLYYYELNSGSSLSMTPTNFNYENAIYRHTEFMTNANGIALKTISFSQQYEWGFNLIPETYDFRLPDLKYQCGAYARQADFTLSTSFTVNGVAASHYSQYDDHQLILTVGQTGTIQLAYPDVACQNRPINVEVFTSANSSHLIEKEWIKFNSQSGLITVNTVASGSGGLRRLTMNADDTEIEAGTYALIIRYQDAYDPNTYYDHKMTIRVLPTQADTNSRQTIDAIPENTCFQNVYPTSFGGCSSVLNGSYIDACEMIVDAFYYHNTQTTYPEIHSDIYLGGSAAQGNPFLESVHDLYPDAFVMRINHVAIPIWYTSISLSREVAETVTALTMMGNYIYAFFTTLQSDISDRQTAFIKIDYTNGIIHQTKSFNFFNQEKGSYAIQSVHDLQAVPSSYASNALALSLTYQDMMNSNQRAGNLRFSDDNSEWAIQEFRSLYYDDDYNYMAGEQLYLAGQTFFYEAHLFQSNFPSQQSAQLYYARIDQGDTLLTSTQAFTYSLDDRLVNYDIAQPRLALDSLNNVYAAFFTEGNNFLFQHNISTANPEIHIYAFTMSAETELNNMDLIAFSTSNTDISIEIDISDYFVVIMHDAYGFFYFTIDTQMTIQSPVRYDRLDTATTTGKIGFWNGADYFTYVRNVPWFNNQNTNEVLVNRKALLYANDNEYDCAVSYISYQSSPPITYTISGSYHEVSPHFTSFQAITTAAQVTFYAWIDSGYIQYEITDNPYISSFVVSDEDLYLLYPAQGSNFNAQYAVGENENGYDTCMYSTGIQPPQTADIIPIQLTLGEANSYDVVNQESFNQCQNLPVSFTFSYEDGTDVQSANNVFLNYTVAQNGDVKLNWNVKDFSPAPSVRLLSFTAYTEQNSLTNRPVTVVQPVFILPSTPIITADNSPNYYTCEVENDFPKVIGDISNDFVSYGADIDPNNGNTVICGYTLANGFPNSYFASQANAAMNLLFDLNGNIYWAYTAQYIETATTAPNMEYLDCQIQYDLDNDLADSVFSLLYISDIGELVMVKQDYSDGLYQYAKVIQGTYDSDGGFVLFNYVTASASGTMAYIYGSRTDITPSTNTFQKYDFSTNYPNEIWAAYSFDYQNQGNNNNAYIHQMGQSDKYVYALSSIYFKNYNTPYANTVKFDAVTGEQLASISFPAQANAPSFSLIVIGDDDLIYMSASTTNDGSTQKKYIRRYDLDLVPDDSVMFLVPESNSYQSFMSDLAVNDTVLFEIFSYNPDKYYMASYLRETLDMLSYKSFESASMNIGNIIFETFVNADPANPETWVFSFAAAQGYLSPTKFSAVINKYDTDLMTENPCLSVYYTDILAAELLLFPGPTTYFNTTHDGVQATYTMESEISYYYAPSYYNLQPATKIYWELKRAPQQISFSPALEFDCTPQGLVLPEVLQHQIIQLPMNLNEDRIYSFALPEVCNSEQLVITVTVDQFPNLPSFISYNSSGDVTYEGIFGRIVFAHDLINDTVAGIYNLNVNVALANNPSNNVVSSFVLSIQPEIPYGSDIDSFYCDDSAYNFMSYGGPNLVGNMYTYVDIIQQGDYTDDYVICGANKLVNNQNYGYYSTFLQKITKGHAVQWHLTIEAGLNDNMAQSCQVSNDDIIYLIVNSADPTNSFNDTIYLFQHSMYAQFLNAKQIYNLGLLLEAHGFYLDRNSGDQYINGIVDGYSLAHTNTGFFIMKLDKDYDLVFYSSFDFGKSPIGGQFLYNQAALMDPSGATPIIISTFGYESDFVNSYRWGLVGLNAVTGLVNIYNSTEAMVSLVNGVEISRNSSRKYQQQGLLLDNDGTYMYSCLVYFASEIHDEIALTQHSASNLQAQMNLQFSRGYLPIETCEIQWQQSTGALVMAVGTFEYTNIFGFNITATQIVNRTSIGLVYYHQRYNPYKIQLFNSLDNIAEFDLVIRTNGFDLNEDKLFFTKFNDIDTPAWDNPCNVSEIQFLTTQTFYLSYNTPNGTDQNDLQYWTDIQYAFKQVSNMTFTDNYIGNPLNYWEYIVDDADYRDSFLNCSRYSNPTLLNPDKVLAESSIVTDLDTPLVVSDTPYVITFVPFQQCSYDTIDHVVVYQDGTTIADFMVFDADTFTLTVNANTNLIAGTYLLSYMALIDGDQYFFNTYDFELVIDVNMPPYPVLTDFTEDVILYTSHSITWNVTLDMDPEGDTAEFSAVLLDTTGTALKGASWFTVISSTSTGIVFEAADPPITDTVNGDQYYINVTVFDKFNVDSPNSYQFQLLVLPDTAPYLDPSINQTLPNAYQGVAFELTFSGSDFIDREGDTPIFSCDILTTAPDANWIVPDISNDLMTVTYTYDGHALNSSYNTLYVFVCSVTDEYLPSINFYQFRLTLSNNQQVITHQVMDASVLRTDNFIFPDLLISCVDPEDQPIIRLFTITDDNGYDIAYNYDQYSTDTGFYWDPETVTLGFEFNDPSYAGIYTIVESCNDTFPRSTPLPTVTFTLVANQNQPPNAVGIIDSTDLWVFINKPPTTLRVDITGLFNDPENDELYIEVRDNNPPTYSLPTTNLDFSVYGNTMDINFPTAHAIATYQLVLRATDPELQQSSPVPFTVKYKQCYHTCQTCFDDQYNDCLTCAYPGAFGYFYKNQCLASCGEGLYETVTPNNGQLVYGCADCPEGCEVCNGPDSNTQCSQCSFGYYLYTDPQSHSTGCYAFCPVNYKVDPTNQYCISTTTALYQECIAFIGNFTEFTTFSYVDSFDNMDSVTESCDDMSVVCPAGQGSNGNCNWDRQFAIQCRETDAGATMIRAATNSLPNHCMDPSQQFPDENQIDFEVIFSVPVASLKSTALTTQTLVDHQQCSLSWTASSTLQTVNYQYVDYGSGSVTGIVGISVNGVPIHSGLSENMYDFFAPKGTGPAAKRVAVDSCLGTNYYSNFYHYYSFSPCMFDNTLSEATSASNCDSNSQCSADYMKYAIAQLPTPQRTLAVVGVARDGHMIIGPYKAAGQLWQPCDVDACNGVTVKGQYVYASTLFYPYTVACWGPATKSSEFGASCSSNTNTCYAGNSFSIFLNFSSMLMLTILALFFLW